MMEPLWQLLVRKELCGLVWSVKPPMHTFSLTDVSLDLNNQMRPVLQLWLLTMQKYWPDLDKDSSHLRKNCLILSHSGGEKEGSKLLVLHIACST
jgi:hypothetical protein